MGRRGSFLGAIVRGMEKSANRAAADGRRQARRHEAIQSRALERQFVRHEREQERSRVRAERETERRRISEERDHAVQQKQEAKDAQIRTWRLEYEEQQEREQDIDRIANDAPEVEDRDRLYAELDERNTFEPESFVAPKPPNSESKARTLRVQAEQTVETAVSAFRPRTESARNVQIGSGLVGLIGIGLFFAPSVAESSIPLCSALLGIGGSIVAHLVRTTQSKRQRDALRRTIEQDVHGRLDADLQELASEDQKRAQAALKKARAAYDAKMAAAGAEFEREEEERLLALRELRSGDVARMREALEGALQPELPVPCLANATVRSADTIALDIDVPEPSVLPINEAKLLASGKVTYKDKPEKRLRDQYFRLVAGLSLRHAAEAMLNVPTCQLVTLRAFRTTMDRSLGRPTRRCVLEVQFDYPTLAPMTMDGIDPVATLKHFTHRLNLDKTRELLPLEGSE